MSDLASLSAQPTPLSLGGETYHLHPLTIGEMGKLQAWVDAQFPDPFDLATRAISRGRVVVAPDGTESREPFTVEQQRHLFKVASDLAASGRRLIGTPEGDAKLRSLPGVMEQLYLSISKGDPTFTREKAAAIVDNLTMGQIARVFSATTTDLVMGADDPKGPAGSPSGATPTETPGGTTTLSSVSAGRRRPKPPTGGSSSTSSRKRGSGRRA